MREKERERGGDLSDRGRIPFPSLHSLVRFPLGFFVPLQLLYSSVSRISPTAPAAPHSATGGNKRKYTRIYL